MYAQKRLKENGFTITIDQWLVLKVLTENPKMMQQEIAEKVFKDNASVTRIINLLVKAGYLIRKTNKADRRKSNLEVTLKGNQIIKEIQGLVEENRANALKGINQKELETVQKVLTQIAENTQQSPL